METVLYYILISLHHIATLALFIEILYISFLKPSRFQLELILLMISTLIMLIGYSIEVYATSPEAAIVGTAVSYLGKPFALLMSLVFIADVCGKPIPKKIIGCIFGICVLFFLVVLTNGATEGGHHLYYSSVKFDLNNTFSPLILEHGPLYWVYMAYIIGMFAAIIIYILTAVKNDRTPIRRRQLNLLLAMMDSTLIGYVLFLTGITSGYDTTMTGAAVGTLFLTILFFRYKLFDSLTLAKEHALRNASTGLLVFDERNKLVYANDMVDRLLETEFTAEELIALSTGKNIVEKGDSVYEVTKSLIEKRSVQYGQTVEINDITAQYRYNIRLERDVEERTREIVNIQRSAITSFAGIVEARDSSTGAHIKRISHIVGLIATMLKDNKDYSDIVDESFISRLMEVAPLHDVGKITIPDAILMKAGRLTEEEFNVIKEHSVKGEQILIECLNGVEHEDYVKLACEIARHHHEKWNGSGYPDGLAGKDIPLAARIVAVADVYDAVRSERCYKAPMTKEEARGVIMEGKGIHFDPDIVDAFLLAWPQIEKN